MVSCLGTNGVSSNELPPAIFSRLLDSVGVSVMTNEMGKVYLPQILSTASSNRVAFGIVPPNSSFDIGRAAIVKQFSSEPIHILFALGGSLLPMHALQLCSLSETCTCI